MQYVIIYVNYDGEGNVSKSQKCFAKREMIIYSKADVKETKKRKGARKAYNEKSSQLKVDSLN